MNEQEYAIMEGSRIHCADEYLNARFGYDDPARRKLFEAGHDAGWKAATAASQAREAELREKLEAAEARIKASQEQEPFKFCDTATGRVHDYAYDCEGNAKAIYLEPVIPPELAELQRENAELRKLLEESKVQEGLRNVLIAVFREIEFKEDYNDGNAPGHAHNTQGIWDDDNGGLSGTECAWCTLWNTAKAMLATQPKEPKQ